MSIHRIAWSAAGTLLAASGLAGGAAYAVSDSCREWRREHVEWKSETVRLFLAGAPQRELDSAIFEMLQREAYLTSCDVAVQGARSELVGWRLVGRAPEEYGAAVLESVLEHGGFDLNLRPRFADASRLRMAAPERPPKSRPGR